MRRRRSNTLGLGGPEPIARYRPKRPHPLRRALIAVVVVLAVVVWIRYDPLTAADQGTDCPPVATTIPAARFGDADAEQFADRRAICVVRNVDATQATITVAVRNDGPVGVDLTGARLSSVPGVFGVDRMAVGPVGDGEDAGELEALNGSAALPGDSTRLVAVTVSLPACGQVDRGRVVTLAELPLRASVLGLPRDVDVTLDPVVRLQTEACPP